MSFLRNPCKGTIRPTGWKRPSGNHEPGLTRGFQGQEPLHDGLDIAFGRSGDPLYAVASGRVILARVEPPPDNSLNVYIDHGGFRTLYGHLSSAKVKTGQKVITGQLVGRVGSSGNVTGPHVHFEIYADPPSNRRTDPWPLLMQNQRVRPQAGITVNIRAKPSTTGKPYATSEDGRITTADGTDLGASSTPRTWGGQVQGGKWTVDGVSGRMWDKVKLENEWRYIAAPLAVRSVAPDSI